MRTLHTALDQLFAAPRTRPARDAGDATGYKRTAITLAAQYGITVEYRRGISGIAVYPPATWIGPDPFDGDHYCVSWKEAVELVRHYAGRA